MDEVRLSSGTFLLYLSSQATSALSAASAVIVLPLLILETTGSAVQVGILGVSSSSAAVVAGVFAGPLVDRFDRPRLMLACDLIRAALFAVVPIIWLFAPQVWLIYVVGAVSAGVSFMFRVAHVTLIPALIHRELLVAANSRVEVVSSTMYLVGPALGGLAFGYLGMANALLINSCLLLWSGWATWSIRSASRGRPEDDGEMAQSRNLLGGLQFLWHTPVLRWLTIALTLLTFATAAAEPMMIYFLNRELAANSTTTGIVLSLAGVGSLTAAFIVPPVRRRLGFAVTWFAGFGAAAIAMMLMATATSLVLAAIFAAVFSLGLAMAGIASVSLRQEITPYPLLGRVTSAFWTITIVLAPAGTGTIMALVATVGERPMMVVTGMICLFVLGLALLTPLRMREPANDEGSFQI